MSDPQDDWIMSEDVDPDELEMAMMSVHASADYEWELDRDKSPIVLD
jgi:hypothetical protein